MENKNLEELLKLDWVVFLSARHYLSREVVKKIPNEMKAGLTLSQLYTYVISRADVPSEESGIIDAIYRSISEVDEAQKAFPDRPERRITVKVNGENMGGSVEGGKLVLPPVKLTDYVQQAKHKGKPYGRIDLEIGAAHLG